MASIKVAVASISTLLMVACSHPIEIVGDGDVLSGTGSRNCYLEDFQAGKGSCTKNLVTGEYAETYYAVPRTGWKFDKWMNYCTNSANSECAFAMPADTVQKNWGVTVAPLVAVFSKKPPLEPSFEKLDSDGNAGFETAREIKDSGVVTDTVSSISDADFFVFTASEKAIYTVTLQFENRDVFLYLYNNDANKTLVGESRVAGRTTQTIEESLLENGRVYTIGVQAKSQSTGQEYRISISKQPYTKPPHLGDLSLDDGSSHIIDYDITGQLFIANNTNVTIADGDINSLWADATAGLRIQGGRIQTAWMYGATADMEAGTIDSLSAEVTRGSISGGTVKEFDNISGSWEISGGTFPGLIQNSYDGSGSFEIKGGNFLGGFKTNHLQGQNKNFIFYGDVDLSLISVQDDEYVHRIKGTLQDGSPIDQLITCVNYDYVATPGSRPCDAVEIHR